MRLIILSLFSLLLACTTAPSYNSTVYAYVDQREINSAPLQHIMIAPVNHGKPSRHYLSLHEEKIDRLLAQYLEKSGLDVIDNTTFRQVWQAAESHSGSLFNSITGEPTSAHDSAMHEALQAAFDANPRLDAVLFTDLIETPQQYQLAAKRFAEWHGVRRKVKMEGVGRGIFEEFNWNETVDAISLSVYLVDRAGSVIFHSIGGIQIAQAVAVQNKSAEFRRRKDLLTDRDEIREAIQLALHPVIPMNNYPARQP